jgi:hypothetical protein
MDYASFEDYWRSFLAAQGPVGVYFANLDRELKARINEAVRVLFRCTGRSAVAGGINMGGAGKGAVERRRHAK